MGQPTRATGPDRERAASAARDRIIAGAMSGTSADGVDVALIAIAGRGPAMTARLLHHHHRAYEPALRQAIFHVRESGSIALATLGEIGRSISLTYSRAVQESLTATSLRPADLACVAAHGQTLYHAPPDTIQWLDPALIAADVGCAVVSDFRRADCAAGGQGAPLVPYADYILFRHPQIDRVLLNLGGIANATVLGAGCAPEDLVAFDTGPGNCISDFLCRRHDPAGPGYDPDGRYAVRGEVLSSLLDEALADPYFSRAAPKSTDGPAMIELFESARRRAGYGDTDVSLEDLLATACELTARTIRQHLARTLRGPGASAGTLEVVASGGGVLNAHLMLRLAAGWPVRLTTVAEWGIPAEAKEAVAFALLGAATLDGVPSNVPSATGARRAVVLGSITPNPSN